MSFAYLRFYTGDYFRDTRGLSMAGHGCYFLLLTYCWDTQGPLPLDEERIAGICEARNQEERNTLQKILRTYFTKMEDGWYNRRLQLEIERSENISRARKSAGFKGYQAKAKQLPSKRVALAKQLHLTPSPSLASAVDVELPETSTARGRGEGAGRGDPLLAVPARHTRETPKEKKARATRLAEDWKIPEDWIVLGLAVHPDWSRAGVIRESLTFRDHYLSVNGDKGLKNDWLRTWRTWIRRSNLEPAR